MQALLGVHHIPMHQSLQHREFIRELQPGVYKVVVVGEEVDTSWCPPNATLVVRYHQLSENWGHRGADDAFMPPSEYGVRGAAPMNEREVAAFIRAHPFKTPVVLESDPLVKVSTRTAITPAFLARAEQCGREHSRIYGRISRGIAAQGFPLARTKFSFLNEPNLWGNEPPEATMRYTVGTLAEMHAQGLQSVVGCFGVGWPGNGGATDAPPIWAPFAGLEALMLPSDWFEMHAYWPLAGPGVDWRWLAGRYTQCPLKFNIALLESGIDRGVEQLGGRGWTDLPGTFAQKAATYIAQIKWFETELRKDSRIVGHTPFTSDGDGQDWASFEMLEPNIMREQIAYAAWVRAQPGGPVVPPVVPPVIPPVIPPVVPPVIPPVIPPTAPWQLTGQLVSQAPNHGTSYVYGMIRNAEGEGLNGKQIRCGWAGAADYAEARSGAAGWQPGYFSIPLFVEGKTPCAGSWELWAHDPVRDIDSARLPFRTDGPGGAVNQVEAAFLLAQTAVVPPAPSAFFTALQAVFPTAVDLTASLATHPTLTYASRSLATLTQLVLHHSTGPQTFTPQACARFHVESNGWPGIGYHLWVDINGVVSLCQPLETISYHVGDANPYAVGICVPGDYRTDAVPPAVAATLQQLAPFLRGWIGRGVPVVGHSDVPGNDTLCPGANLYALLPSLNGPVVALDDVRNAAWQALYPGGIPYNPDAAFAKYARAHNLGAPVTREFATAPYVGQGYAAAIVYTQAGEWANLRTINW